MSRAERRRAASAQWNREQRRFDRAMRQWRRAAIRADSAAFEAEEALHRAIAKAASYAPVKP